jgi:hypothetical protein
MEVSDQIGVLDLAEEPLIFVMVIEMISDPRG